MRDLAPYAVGASFVLLVAGLVATIATGARYSRYLRAKQPEAWAELRSGRADDPIRSDLAHVRFLLTSSYERFGDSELSARARVAKVVAVLYAISFALFVLLRTMF